jgi:hypothetical protein
MWFFHLEPTISQFFLRKRKILFFLGRFLNILILRLPKKIKLNFLPSYKQKEATLKLSYFLVGKHKEEMKILYCEIFPTNMNLLKSNIQ